MFRFVTVLVLMTCAAVCNFGQTAEQWISPVRPPCLDYVFQTQPALSARQKFCYFLEKRAVTPSGVFGAAFTAGFAQLTNNPKEWGGGAAGYGRRFGTRFAQGLTKSSTESLVGILDREDPRLSPSSEAGTMLSAPSRIVPRLGKALLKTIWTPRNPSEEGIARNGLAYSRIAGSFASGFIGMSWTPGPDNTVGQALGRTGTAFAGYAATNVWTEFQPDIVRLVGAMIGQRKPKPSL
jgi:hypothetical protein